MRRIRAASCAAEDQQQADVKREGPPRYEPWKLDVVVARAATQERRSPLLRRSRFAGRALRRGELTADRSLRSGSHSLSWVSR